MCVCTLPLVIGQAKSKCTVLYYHLWPVWLHIISKVTISEDVREYKMRDFLYSIVWNKFYSKNSSATYKKCTALQVKYLLLLSRHTWIWQFSKHRQIPNFVKIRPVGAELLQVERHDKDKSLFTILRMCPKNRSSRSRMLEGSWNCINLFWDRDRWQALVSAVVKLSGSFLTSWKPLTKNSAPQCVCVCVCVCVWCACVHVKNSNHSDYSSHKQGDLTSHKHIMLNECVICS